MQIGTGKQGVRIGEYANTEDHNGVIGWIEPSCDNPQWIMWFTLQGDALLYTERESSGAVVGDAVKIKASAGRLPRKQKQ